MGVSSFIVMKSWVSQFRWVSPGVYVWCEGTALLVIAHVSHSILPNDGSLLIY